MGKETQMTMSEKKKEKKISTTFIPDDILFNMFSRLPVKSLLRLRWTCKYWFDLIEHPDFVKMHLHHSTTTSTCAATRDYGNTSLFFISRTPSLDLYFGNCSDLNYYSPPPKIGQFDYFKLPIWFDHHTIRATEEDNHYKMVQSRGSCNGLILLYSSCITCDYEVDEYEYFLWNPSTRELKKLPCRKYDDNPQPKFRSVYFNGFGYDHTIDDYKVIDIVCYLHGDDGGAGGGGDDDVVNPEIIINIYTLRSNSWSTKIPTHQSGLGDFCLKRNIISYLNKGCFFNGSLHWILKCAILSMSLDTVEVEHRQLKPPNDGKPPNDDRELQIYKSKLEVLNGCLCMIYYISSDDYDSIVEFWMMNDYGVNESWTKLFMIDSRKFNGTVLGSYLNDMKPIELSKDGGILMVFNERYLVLYDLKNEKHRWIHRIGDHRIDPEDSRIDHRVCLDYAFVIENYIESLVSLKSGMFLTAAGSTTTTTVQNPQ